MRYRSCTARRAATFLLCIYALLVAPSAGAQRAARGAFEGAAEMHPSIGFGGGVGFGFDLRGTYWAAREGQAIVGPDFLVGWIGFSDEGPANAGLIRLMGGVRLAFPSRDVRPSIYGRAGFQGLRHRHWHHLHHWHGPLDFTAALALEGGGAIDFAVAPNVTLGGHAGLNLLTSGHAYLNLGAHLAVRF